MRPDVAGALRALLALLCVGLLCAWSPAAAAQGQDYRIGPGDVLKITVYRAPDMESTVRVSEQGDISMPAIGALKAADLTASQVADRIADELKTRDIFLQPSVNVLVVEMHSKTVSVLGAVQKPGEIVLDRPGLTVAEILARAGATFTSNAGRVSIVDSAAGTREQLSLADLASGAHDRPVRPGEVLFVQPPPTFFIRGEVNHAGEYPVTPGLTVGKAIALGGGLTDRGSASRVRLERRGADGAVTRQPVRGKVVVQPGDLLIVGARLF